MKYLEFLLYPWYLIRYLLHAFDGHWFPNENGHLLIYRWGWNSCEPLQTMTRKCISCGCEEYKDIIADKWRPIRDLGIRHLFVRVKHSDTGWQYLDPDDATRIEEFKAGKMHDEMTIQHKSLQ